MFEQLTAKLAQIIKEYPAAQYGNKRKGNFIFYISTKYDICIC